MIGWLSRMTELGRPRGEATIPCPLCGERAFRTLGVRGNREHAGADPHAEPHLVTNVARCVGCDFVYANPPIAEAGALEAAHYGSAGTYHASSSDARATAMFRERLRLIGRYVDRGARLLDVGAGKGELVREAIRSSYRAEGVEPSAGLAAHASGEGLPVSHGHLSGEGPAFDVVTLCHVLEHTGQPLDLLRRAHARLAPGGIVFVEVPNVDAHLARAVDVWFRLRRRDWSCRLSPVHPPFHSYGYTARSLRWALEHAGFEVVAITTRSGRERGTSGHGGVTAAAIDAAFTAFSALGNRELLLAVGRRRSA